MKKLLSMLLVFALLLSVFPAMASADSQTTVLEHRLTCDNKTLYTAQPGEIITVTITIRNQTAIRDFVIKNFQTEIYYDDEFFDYVENSIEINSELQKPGWRTDEGQHHYERRVALNIMSPSNDMLECKSSQVIGTFKLKVRDDAQVGDEGDVIPRLDDIYAIPPDSIQPYDEMATPLKVVIGGPVEGYTITFMDENEVFKTLIANPEVNIPNGPSKSGKTFLGWKKVGSEDGELWQPGQRYTATGDTTFTAVWGTPDQQGTYTLTFVTNGGSDIAPVTKESGATVNLSVYTPSRSGYTFNGWYSNEALTNKVTSVTLNQNTAVYAKWTEKSTVGGGGGGGVTKYTISFETNGGTEIEDVEKVSNSTVDLSKYVTTKEGYGFDGWYTDKELTNKVPEIKMTGNVTLYAKWVEGGNGEVNKPGNYKPDIMTDEHYAYILGREDGLIHPEDNLTRAEAATIFFRLLDDDVRTEAYTKENVFVDVNDGDWFNAAVSTLANLEILNGRTLDTFEPSEPITRAELTTIVARLSEASYDGEDLFPDIAEHWARNYINIAASINWVEGDDGFFRPDDNITRAEVMTLINRVLNRLPESADDLLGGMLVWPDNTNKNIWYYIAIQEATNSHDYDMKEDGIHENWTLLTKNRDWSKLEN